MFLKELQMAGFKSFAQPIRVELGPGVTAVVGPNGSGKSNIVDAVRWVLGEQSARALRGARSEDVIFAGSVARHALGMAEVTLVLDNAEGMAGGELAELAITRRLFRSGDTEYLLNRRRARLRDILDVAGRVGLGPDSYCVVGQGAIEQLALQRPQERRALLADAADVRRHEARLGEIESDLTQVRNTTSRTQAVVDELRPQVERLRGQAERAERHRQIREDVERAAAAWFGRHVPLARAGVEAAAAHRAVLRARVDGLAIELVEADGQRQRLQERLRVARAEGRLLQERLQQARSERESLRIEGAKRGQELQLLASRSDQIRAEGTTVEHHLQAAREQLAESQEASRVADSGEDASWLAANQTLSAANQDLAQARRDLAAEETAMARCRGELQALDLEEARLEAESRAAEAALQRARTERDRSEARVAELTEATAQHEGTLRAEQEALHEAGQAAAAARAPFADGEARLRDAERRVAAAASEQDRYRGEQEALDRLARSGADTALAADRLLTHLPAQEPYRQAVAASLGAAVEYTVIAGVDSAWWVGPSDEGRGRGRVLTPAGNTTGGEIEVFRAWVEGVVGVRVPYRLAVDVLETGAHGPLAARYLGRTVVVASVAEARQIGALLLSAAAEISGAEPAFQIATESGECLYSTGERVLEPWGGSLQAMEIQARRGELAHLATAASVVVETAQTQLAVAREALARSRLELNEAEQRRSGLAAAVRRRREQLNVLQGELTRERAQVARLARAEAAGAEGTRGGEIPARRQKLLADLGLAQARTETAAGRVGAAEAQRDAAAQLREELLLDRAVAQERTQRLSEAAERDRREVAGLEHRQGELRAETQRMDAQRARLDAEDLASEARLGRQETAVASLEAQDQAAAAALGELEIALDQHATRQQAVQRSVADARAEEAASGTEEERARGVLARLEVELHALAEVLAVEPAAVLERPVEPNLSALDDESLQRRLARAQRDLRSVGSVDYTVLGDYARLSDRYLSLTTQLGDLAETEIAIREGMDEVRQRIREQFMIAFAEVNRQFGETFRELFRGGDAELTLSGDPDSAECGVEIMAQPPGKRLHRLATLSGGERALVGAALLLALIATHPSPFCLLDEVDAALDDTNVSRFLDRIKEMSDRTQFVLVTHNRATMEMADALYGVTMSTAAVSQVVAVRLPL